MHLVYSTKQMPSLVMRAILDKLMFPIFQIDSQASTHILVLTKIK